MTVPSQTSEAAADTASTLLLLAGSIAVGVALSQLFGGANGRSTRGQAVDAGFSSYGDDNPLPPDVEAAGGPAAAYGDPERAALGLQDRPAGTQDAAGTVEGPVRTEGAPGTEGAPRP